MSESEGTRNGRSDETLNRRPSTVDAPFLARWMTLGVPLAAVTALVAVALWDARFYADHFDGELGVVENIQAILWTVEDGGMGESVRVFET